eukprot:TRINITY_DN9540_c0_g1_i5.p1 TRINITY_DN9540_c0_g1~~TRINITY_DN9540_c0_g1_i5.p1  ORF type:complete len:337 (-),score=55.37 TRINITY_DN9540_c0_g1_i5:270-1280(-)
MSKQMKKPAVKQIDRASQAVILANCDNCSSELQPILSECPPVLLSLVNERVIDYSVELLVGAGIKDIIIVSSGHHEDIQAYVSQSHWRANHAGVRLDVFVAPHCRTFGDALRELDREMRLIGDFVVLSGDVMAEVDLSDVLDFHSIRRGQSRDCVMTMVTALGSASYSPVWRAESPLVGIDRSTGRVQRYGRAAAPAASGKQAKEVYHDCHIDVLTQQALCVLHDNFDWDRAELLSNVLAPLTDPDEIPLGTVYAHVLGSDDFAVRLCDPRAYTLARYTPAITRADLSCVWHRLCPRPRLRRLRRPPLRPAGLHAGQVCRPYFILPFPCLPDPTLP